MRQKWTNWSGSLSFRPENIAYPENEEALAQLVRRARAEQRKVRVAGKTLHEAGLDMHNIGDVDVKTVVGTVSTATHGTGRRLQNLSSMQRIRP